MAKNKSIFEVLMKQRLTKKERRKRNIRMLIKTLGKTSDSII